MLDNKLFFYFLRIEDFTHSIIINIDLRESSRNHNMT